MREYRLEVEREEAGPNRWVFRARGGLLGNRECYAFQEEVRKTVAGGGKRVAVDLSGIQRISSSGIGILTTMMWSASNAGSALVLASLSPKVEKVLGIAMLLDHIDHAESVEAALAKLDGMELAAPAAGD